jgi:hypothetical protein
MRAAAVVLACALVGGCASLDRDFADEKESWQGADYDEVVTRWGQPTSGERLADGIERRTWVSEGVSWQPGPTVGLGVFGGGRGSGVGVGVNVPIGAPPPPVHCERTLYFRDGRVVDQEWNGPWDYCSSFSKR